jgi:hypothetical protein
MCFAADMMGWDICSSSASQGARAAIVADYRDQLGRQMPCSAGVD